MGRAWASLLLPGPSPAQQCPSGAHCPSGAVEHRAEMALCLPHPFPETSQAVVTVATPQYCLISGTTTLSFLSLPLCHPSDDFS